MRGSYHIHYIFSIFGIEKWPLLAITWSIVPLINTFIFIKAPLAEQTSEQKNKNTFKTLFSDKYFLLLIIIMFCAACCELSVSQWSSAFAEKALGLSKATGDLFGTLLFAAFMGLSRVTYPLVASKLKISLERFILYSTLLCIASYLVIALCPIPIISLIGIAVCGFSVGMLWPGTFSLGAANIKEGGTTMFALLALFGDLGCGLGPFTVGRVAAEFNDNLNIGILFATLFPLIMCACLILFNKNANKQ